jgi:hypothetical protein
MIKKIALTMVFAWVAAIVYGQAPVKFRSTEWLGFSSGEVGSAGQVQTVNGVSKGPWFLGLGGGVDYYRFRSVPLFLSVTRDISLGKRDWLFLYLDGGINEPWYKRPASTDDSYSSSSFHSGGYYSGGVGYLWKLGAKTSKALLFTAGYTVKKLKEDQFGSMINCGNGIPCPLEYPETVVYEYLCRAYQFMVGFRF